MNFSRCESFLFSNSNYEKLLKKWKFKTNGIYEIIFFSFSGSSDGIIKVWDCERQYCTHNLRDYSGVVSILQFHPTKLIIFSSASDNKIKGWDLKSSR